MVPNEAASDVYHSTVDGYSHSDFSDGAKVGAKGVNGRQQTS